MGRDYFIKESDLGLISNRPETRGRKKKPKEATKKARGKQK
jgi:hypothetical protein